MGSVGPIQLFVVLLALAGYLLPTFVSIAARGQRTVWIAPLNVLVGWTGIGWLIALVWAFSANNRGRLETASETFG
ncbi:MAG: superinfection immunity protein [Pseudomonadota bacterium]